jgi:hypothetical protein
MAKGDHEFRGKPSGATGGGYTRPRVQIGFDPEQIALITKWAKHHGRSFTAEVRALVDEALKRRTR